MKGNKYAKALNKIELENNNKMVDESKLNQSMNESKLNDSSIMIK